MAKRWLVQSWNKLLVHLKGHTPSDLLLPVSQGNLSKNPYWRVMRGDKLAGFLLLLLPVLWSIAFFSYTWWQILVWSLFFAVGTFMIRSAGCVINDMMDYQLDKKVSRTATRPLAAGELSLQQATKLLAALLATAFAFLCILPWTAFFIGLLTIIPITLYPLMKRFTNYPQVFLGFTYNLGIFTAWLTIGRHSIYAPFLLYICAVLWTIGYDTVYAHQDKKDDATVGIGSMALALGGRTKEVVWRMYFVLISGLAVVGLNTNMGILFYLGILLALYQLNWQIEGLDIDDAKDCQRRFRSNIDFGIIVLLAILLGRLA